jgi:hypothetical protein
MRTRASRKAASKSGKTGADGDPEQKGPARVRAAKAGARKRHSVYVVYLRNPKGDGKAGYYVGMTGLTPERRLANHLNGIKAARIVTKYGVRLVPTLYEHLNPLTYEDALRLEGELANSLKKRGFQVFGGH